MIQDIFKTSGIKVKLMQLVVAPKAELWRKQITPDKVTL